MQSPVLKRAGWVTWLILGLCLAFTLFTNAGGNQLTRYWLFESSLIQRGEIWRLITPIFLHFSMLDSPVIHLLFNGLWWVVIGGAIEKVEGSWRLMLLTLVSGIFSNIAAYKAYGPWFGGLSGVCFAIIGYAWLRGWVYPYYRSVVAHRLFIIFAVFLLLGYTNLFGPVANMAHLSGLITGTTLALIYTGVEYLNKLKKNKNS